MYSEEYENEMIRRMIVKRDKEKREEDGSETNETILSGRRMIDSILDKYRVEEYCEKYRLEDEIQEIIFNKRFNKDGLGYVFAKGNNFTELFWKAIKTRITNHSNINLVLFGVLNSGKSEVGQAIALKIKKIFKIILQKEVKIHIVFGTNEFDDIIPQIKLGDVTIRDESPKVIGLGSRNIQYNMDNITKIIRANQNSFILVNPKPFEVEVVDYYLQTAGKDIENRVTRCILYDENKQPLGIVFIKLHNKKEFREDYIKKKKANIAKVIVDAGLVSAEINKIRFEKDFYLLLDHCKVNHITMKSSIKAQIVMINMNANKPEDMIKGDTNYLDDLIQNVYLKIKKQKLIDINFDEKDTQNEEIVKPKGIIDNETKQAYLIHEKINSLFTFLFDDALMLKRARLGIEKHKKFNSGDIERNFEIYTKVNKKVNRKEIVEDYGVSNVRITQIINVIRGTLNRLKGFEFEEQYFKHIERLKTFDKVEWFGRKVGAPDILCHDLEKNDLHIFSLKRYSIDKKHHSRVLKSQFNAELTYMNDHKDEFNKIYVVAVILDNNTNRIKKLEIKPDRTTPFNLYKLFN